MEASFDQLTCARRLFFEVFIGYKFIVFHDRAKSHLCIIFRTILSTGSLVQRLSIVDSSEIKPIVY